MPNNITLKGFDLFGRKLKDLPEDVLNEVDYVVKLSGELWEERAKMDAPVDQGFLRGQIKSDQVLKLKNEVTSPAEYSAYIEWGTKLQVNVPSELQAYANQFKGRGAGGGDPKKMIYDWAARVGIPPEKRFFVFLSIMKKGIRPHPFFFIQSTIVEKQMVKDIKQILETGR